MKARLQTSMGQSLVMTPQLRQAIRLLQMSSTELELELTEAVETNPLLEWAENTETNDGDDAPTSSANDDAPIDPAQGDINAEGEDWDGGDEDWSSARSGSFDDEGDNGEREQAEDGDTLADHLL